MTQQPPKKLPPLESGLLEALRALDNQIAREMQRTPAEREEHGVQKWEPFQKRVESATAFLLNCLGDDAIKLDSVIILAQAFPKALLFIAQDLGEPGLGEIRASYLRKAMEQIIRDGENALGELSTPALN